MMQYDDTYNGPRWTYGSTLRPFNQFFGYWPHFIAFTHAKSLKFATFGTMQSSAEIPPEQAAHWDLVLVAHTEGVTI